MTSVAETPVDPRIAEILARPYARVLERGEDGWCTARVLEFPGCISEGDTPAAAIENVDEALTLYIEDLLENGDPVPEPIASRPHNGRISLRLTPHLHAEAVRHAQARGISLNRFLAEAVASYIGAGRT